MKQISMIVFQIHVEMVRHVLIMSKLINVFAKFHSPAEIVTTKWIHAYRIVVIMEPNAHQVQIIKIFHAVARLDTPDDYVTRISMNAHYRHHVEMVQHAKIFPAHINACAQRDMKVETVR